MMRVFGLKLVPVVLASVAVYAVGALIYGLLFSAQWMAWSGRTEADFVGHEWRMALSWIMPIMISLGVGWVMSKTNASTLVDGIRTGAVVGLLLMVATRAYTFVYGIEPVELLLLDCAHLLLNAVIAGAVLGAMKATVPALSLTTR